MRILPRAFHMLSCWLLCAALQGATIFANDDAERVAKLLAPWKKADAPGAAWVVISNGAVAGQGTFGLANIEQRTPIADTTLFNLGSISKQFTGLALLILAQQEKLALDDDVRRFVPEFPDQGGKIQFTEPGSSHQRRGGIRSAHDVGRLAS